MKEITLKIRDYRLSAFDYDPNIWGILELDIHMGKGWGSVSREKIEDKLIIVKEKTILHLVLFRTKFSIKKVSKELKPVKKVTNCDINWGAF